MAEEKCDCVAKLDKLRMDLEAGRQVAFVCYVFPENPDDFERIGHRASVANMFTVAFDALRQANKKADAQEREE